MTRYVGCSGEKAPLRNPDRRVHARTRIDSEVHEVVRYERAGKWWLESPTSRRPLTLAEAVRIAATADTVLFSVPGGKQFDAKVNKVRR